MNIAFFSESYKPYISGVTNSIETLKTGLEELGNKVLVFSPSYPGASERANVFRFPSVPAPYPGYRLAVPVSARHFETLKDNKVQLIHSHSPYQLGLLSMRYARKLNIPFIFTMHTLLSQYMHYVPLIPENISSSITNSYIKWFCNKCDAVIAPTKRVKDELVSIGIKCRIEVVPTGIDISHALSANPAGIRAGHEIPDNAKVLLFVGRLAREKNIAFLLEAFEILKEKNKNIYLLIVAGGPQEKELKALAGGSVIFAGAIPYPEVFNYFAASDVFVFSSLSETQGLVLAEAMSCGLPQVAVDAEGVSSVVKDHRTGFLTPLSINEFASKVQRLLDDKKLWQAFSAQSRETAKNEYSKQAFANKIESIYKSML